MLKYSDQSSTFSHSDLDEEVKEDYVYGFKEQMPNSN
jgi:hypothetical protein